MTRQECEDKILEKLEEIVEIYHEYNPNGEYLAMFYHLHGVNVNNEYWDGGNDEDHVVNARKVETEVERWA